MLKGGICDSPSSVKRGGGGPYVTVQCPDMVLKGSLEQVLQTTGILMVQVCTGLLGKPELEF